MLTQICPHKASLGHNESFLDMGVQVIYVSNCHLYIGIIIFPYIDDNLQLQLRKNKANLRDLKAATGL